MFCRELYLDEYTAKHFHSIRRKIKKQLFQPSIYVLILNRENKCVEYMHNGFLCQKYYKLNKPFIIGLASSKDNINQILLGIMEETHAFRGDYNIYEFLKVKIDRFENKRFGLFRYTVMNEEGSV